MGGERRKPGLSEATEVMKRVLHDHQRQRETGASFETLRFEVCWGFWGVLGG